jgi:hypothetical protein
VPKKFVSHLQVSVAIFAIWSESEQTGAVRTTTAAEIKGEKDMKSTFRQMIALFSVVLGGNIVDGDGCSAVRSHPWRWLAEP